MTISITLNDTLKKETHNMGAQGTARIMPPLAPAVMHKDGEMENMGAWKIVKIGFLLGIGFVIPLIGVVLTGAAISALTIPPVMQKVFDDASEGVWSDLKSDADDLKRIKILSFTEQLNGNNLFIVGAIKNVSEHKASSIQLEAELIDSNGEFVYECSEYINRDLNPGDKENFQIRCGCGDTIIPEYKNINVRVVSLSNF